MNIRRGSVIENEYTLKDVVVIHYDYHIAPDVLERWMWTATLNGDAFDYHHKKILIEKAEAKGLNWVVTKRTKNNQLVVTKTNICK